MNEFDTALTDLAEAREALSTCESKLRDIHAACDDAYRRTQLALSKISNLETTLRAAIPPKVELTQEEKDALAKQE